MTVGELKAITYGGTTVSILLALQILAFIQGKPSGLDIYEPCTCPDCMNRN
jgi:hypothetical protein